ncbi:hypothetical protein LO762_09260 [Actinocorallia sp. API 0066]|uniref:hypothetical protein n=1 Tax=Actinocorallia sp. API 0066 TaxID=2896846 RepID=UPI001E307E73|nr:hypothetical protein [Actinocorallia sp. API 0066]MCD0449376.1 hypothetical protein [Actinocorallia sp. API 0066]
MLRNESIGAELSGAGHLVRITRAGRSYGVRVLHQWQAPGEGRLYRLQVREEDGAAVAIAEVAYHHGAFRLQRWWD